MDLQQLSQALAPQNGTLQIDVGTLGGAFADLLARSYYDQGKTIEISAATGSLDSAGQAYVVTGTGGLMIVDKGCPQSLTRCDVHSTNVAAQVAEIGQPAH